MPPSNRVLHAFGVLHDHAPLLPGGQGRTFGTERVVLKPVVDACEARWIADVLESVAEDGFRVARPLRARDGDWIVDGWSAWERIAGRHDFRERWPEIIELCRRLNHALRPFERTPVLNALEDPYTLADRIAWDEASAVLPPPVASLSRRFEVKRPGHEAAQLVHGDLSGNVLFADGLAPGVIDFSPYWRPACYAVAIVVIDALTWHHAGPQLLSELRPSEVMQLNRAATFRLTAAGLLHAGDPPVLERELGNYERLVALIDAPGHP